MWIIEDVQATILRKFDSKGSLIEKSPIPEMLTLTIEVRGWKRVWIIDVENTTTVIMLKNILRQRYITRRSCDEINIFFKSVKLSNSYWYLRDYDVENYSSLMVVHRRVSRVKRTPRRPMLLEMKDSERKDLVMQRLQSRRLEDVFHFIMLHALFDPNCNESSYLLSEVEGLGAFKRPTETPDSEEHKTSTEFIFSGIPINTKLIKATRDHSYK